MSSHSDSFQVKLPNVFTNYPLGAVRVEDQKFIDWDHYKFTLCQTQLNFAVFCASSANDKDYISIPCSLSYRRILKIMEIPLPYENSFNQSNNS